MRRSLPPAPDALWSAIDRKVRNQVRKAQKEGLEATIGGADLVEEFYRVFSRNMRDLGTPVYPKHLFSETLRLLPSRARVSVVRYRGQAVAAGIVIAFRDTVLNPWASSLREYRHLCPNMLLYWTLLEHAIQSGATMFDFGRSSPGGGTHQFKLQWGASETPLHWEYALIARREPPDQGPSNPRFERAIRLWQRLPLGVANVIGPHIARQLP
jgi:FemAB-related protein (PEP-CTERM system-associated)